MAASSSQPGHSLLAGASGGRPGAQDEGRAVCGCVHMRELARTHKCTGGERTRVARTAGVSPALCAGGVDEELRAGWP